MNNEDLVKNMDKLQRMIYVELCEQVTLNLCGSWLYGAATPGESDFDFYISESDLKSIKPILEEYGFQEVPVAKYRATGKFFGAYVYRHKVGIDIQIIFNEKFEKKQKMEAIVKTICDNFKPPQKPSRECIMQMIVEQDMKAESNVFNKLFQ